MSRPVVFDRTDSVRGGFTLVEIMVAVALTLLMMTMVVSIFGLVMDNISSSRSTIEMSDKLRYTRERLQKDLAGITVTPMPPVRPEDGQGYFEYIEGSVGPGFPSAAYAEDDDGGPGDYTSGDFDDVLMFTSKSQDEPFVGRFTVFNPANNQLVSTMSVAGPTQIAAGATPTIKMVESRVAEIAWFMRGNSLYRRVLLVLPSPITLPGEFDPSTGQPRPFSIPTTQPSDAGNVRSYYGLYDVSARMENGPHQLTPGAGSGNGRLVANSLSDLTKRENRYGHQPFAWPYDARGSGFLGLPTLQECCSWKWPFPYFDGTPATDIGAGNLAASYDVWSTKRPVIFPNYAASTPLLPDIFGRVQLTPLGTGKSWAFDAWHNPTPWNETQPVAGQAATGQLNYYVNPATHGGVLPDTRIAEDLILTNVLSFDVKAFDPGVPVLVRSTSPDEAISPLDRWLPIPEQYAYIEALRDFINNTGTVSAVGFGAFVDLNYMMRSPVPYVTPSGVPAPLFGLRGNLNSAFGSTAYSNPGGVVPPIPPNAAIYDTWSTHYEQDGINQGDFMTDNTGTKIPGTFVDEGTNGIDDDGQNGVDDPGEQEAPLLYAAPLRAIQVRIRVFDPDSRQVREVTLEHEFLP